MKYLLCLFAVLAAMVLTSPAASAQEPWADVLSTGRATDWTQAGLPGDIPPDIANSWTQCTANVPGCSGSTTKAIPSCGSSGSGVSPSICGISAALSNCGSNHYVLLAGSAGAAADFYLTGSINLPSNCVLRGGGAAYSRIHAVSSGSYGCNGMWGLVCIIGSNTYANGNCGVWPCPSSFNPVAPVAHTANWTSGYTQGTQQITVDNVTGIVANVTPMYWTNAILGFRGIRAISPAGRRLPGMPAR